MSSMSSLADASSGAGEELSFTKYGKTMGHESAQWKSKDSEAGEELSFTKYGKTMGHESAQIRGPLSSTAQWKSNDSEVYSENYLRHQLFLKAAEAKKWQDSVLHLAGVATGKDEELNLERSRNIQMAAALERAEDAAELRQLELESTREENQAALQQVAALQSEMQSILSTCSLLESRSIQLESVLQQERNARKLASENLERVRVEAAAALDQADWCRERSRQEVLELQVRLHAADSELQAAHLDRQHALRFAESLHVSTAALAHESQREVNQSLYLQQEVQRLVRVCSEQRKQQAHQHEQILSLQLLVETLEARLQEGTEVRDMLERERNEKILLQNQLRACLGNFSEVCVRQQLLVSFVEEARVFLAQLLADLGFAQQLLALARYGGEASVFIDLPALTFVRADKQIESQTLGVEEKDFSRLTSMDIALEKVEKERKVSRTASQDQLAIPEENVLLDYTRDKQNELHTLLSLGDHGTGCEDLEGVTLGLHRELESCQNRMEGYETALAEMEVALEKAERERKKCESQLRKDLEERNAQLAIAEENVLKGCETAEGLREQIAILQKGKDRTETSQSKRLNEIEKVCELEGAMNKTLALAEATLAAERQTMQEKEARYVREVKVAVAAEEEVRARLEESERMRRAVVQESDRMEREQQEASAHAAELEAQVARLQEEVCTAHKEASCLQGRLEDQLATLQTQLENIIQGQTQLEDIIQRNQHEKEEFQDRIKKLEADREEYQGKLTEAHQHVQRVQDESAEAQAKADAALERMGNEMAGFRVTLAEAQQHQHDQQTLLSLGEEEKDCSRATSLEVALEKAERERKMRESQLRKDLEERNAQLAIAEENVLKGCETAEGLREQIAILQKDKDRTETSQSKRLNEIEKVCELEGAMNKTLALAEATLAAERQTMQEKEARYVREVKVAVAAEEEVRARLKESERMRRAVVQESDRMEREQQEASAHAAELEAQVARLQEEVCTAHKEASCLQGRLEDQLATLQTQLENIIQGQTQLEDIIQRNQHEKEEFQDRIKKLEADREEYQGKLTEAHQHVQRVQDESAEAQAKADAALERMGNEMAGFRVTLAEAQQHQLGEETRSSCKCSEFQVLQQQLQECEMQVVGARQTEAAMREEAQSLREKNDDLKEKIEDLQVKLVEIVETQVLASRGGSAGDKREQGASCEVAEDLRELREKTFRLQDVERKLVAAEERVYITEEELQQACDTAEELRQQLQEARQEVRVLSSELQKVSGRSGSRETEIQEPNKEELEKVVADLRRQLADAQADGGGDYGPGGLRHGGGAASGDGEESIGEEIEEEVMCDGFCETAEELRRRLSELEVEKDKEMEERLKEGELKSAMILQTQRLEAELKHAQDELAKERERRERRLELLSKGDDDSFDNEAECKGGCETAQQLRHELQVAEARSDDAELENEVLQRKLALCQSELEAVRSKYHVPENFFSSDA